MASRTISARVEFCAKTLNGRRFSASHTFRHIFSILIKSLGEDAKVVQELLRHASFKTTMDGYTQALEAPKRQAQSALADLVLRTGKVGHA